MSEDNFNSLWTQIDQLRARIEALERSMSKSGKPNMVSLDKEHDRIIRELDVLDGTYAAHQNWSQRDKDRRKVLRARLQEIRPLLGVKF